MMKRFIVLLLTAAMLITFVSCGKKNENTADDTGEVTAEITEELTTPVINDPAPVEAELTRGKTSGDEYVSEYAQLTFNKPDAWEYASDVKMAELLNLGAEKLSEEAIAETLTDTTMVYDMIATDTSTGNNVSVSYENMNRICGKAVTSSEYMEFLKERVSQQMQVDYKFTGEETVTLSGNEYNRVIVAIKTDLFEMTQAYYIRVVEDVAICVTTTLIGDMTVEDIEAMFA